MKKRLKITVKEAVEQGYNLFGYKDREFQQLQTLEDIIQEDFDTGEVLVLAEKNPRYRSISAAEIQELVFDYMYDIDEMADDTDFMHHNFTTTDFKPLSDLINERFSKITYYFLTDIEIER